MFSNIKINFESLWKRLSDVLDVDEIANGENSNYIIRIPSNYLKVRVGYNGKNKNGENYENDGKIYSNIVCVSRHFVTKSIYTIEVINKETKERSILQTTNDHTCAVYNKNNKSISFKDAKDLKVGENIPLVNKVNSDKKSDDIGYIRSVTIDKNVQGCWVYDLEVESGEHVYFANGVLVHNSQFINLAPITQTKCKEAGLPITTRFSDLPQNVKQSVIDDAYHILDLVNANVEQLINTNCFTNHGNVLHYALEYIASEGFYFKKKHYIVHKIISDDIPCDKFKYSGISVKKAEIPASMKTFLKDIYESTMKYNWTEQDYINAVQEAYNKFITLPWEDTSFYKKLRTPKIAISLTTSEKGAGAHARAANFYNGLLSELNLGGKYPVIGVGDEMRYSYIIPTNQYGQDVIGFKGVFPEEFKNIFKPDYNKMFEKIFLKSLENYIKIMHYSIYDPTKSVEDITFDIF